MPDSNTSQDASTAQKTDANASTAQATTETVSKAEFLELKNSLARLIRLQGDQNKKPDAEATSDTTDKSTKKSAADKELDARVARIEAAAKRTAENAKKNEVKTHFASVVGLTGDALTDAVDLFLIRNEGKIIYDEETGAVVFKDSAVYDAKPFSEWFTEADAAGRFKGQKPGKDAPRTGPNGGTVGKAGVTQISKRDIATGKFDPAQLKKALAGDKSFEIVP